MIMMVKESCELHATAHVYRDIPPNEQNDLPSGLLHSTKRAGDNDSNSDGEMRRPGDG